MGVRWQVQVPLSATPPGVTELRGTRPRSGVRVRGAEAGMSQGSIYDADGPEGREAQKVTKPSHNRGSGAHVVEGSGEGHSFQPSLHVSRSPLQLPAGRVITPAVADLCCAAADSATKLIIVEESASVAVFAHASLEVAAPIA